MWPFKRKKEILTPKIAKSVLCIPGNWKSWDEFTLLIVSSTNGEYLAAANILMNPKTNHHYIIDFCDHDPKMKDAFKYAGMATRITQKTVDLIDNHNSVVYISGETGNSDNAEHIANAGSAILKAGGLGIKVETAGKAFEKENWLALTDNFEQSNLYQMFVIDSITNADGSVFSCGMHNLGLRDTIISGHEFQESVALISLFGYYQIVDNPTIQNMQTFGPSIESPVFRITDELNQPYKNHDLFGNPYGMWRLTQE